MYDGFRRDMKVAIGTHDRENMHDEHVGDSSYFAIYEVSPESYELLEYRENTSPEERMHGDPNKAKAIMNIVEGTDVLVGRAMGPNFIRIRDNSPYLPVIVRGKYRTIEDALHAIMENYGMIRDALERKRNGEKGGKPVIIE